MELTGRWDWPVYALLEDESGFGGANAREQEMQLARPKMTLRMYTNSG